VLDPYDRLQLATELRPPDGFAFAGGIGTTFSLDLESLLIVPMSLVLCEFESREHAMENPEALLEGVRRIAGNLQIFCHRGRIKRPSRDNPLFAFLEDMVIEALPQAAGSAFHPKVWVLRYRSETQTLLRVLVLSRNLTFDRSWDTALIVEGVVQPNRPNTVRKSGPLAQFLRALPGLAIAPPSGLSEVIDGLVQNVLRTEFDPPDGFEGGDLWPLGVGATEPDLFSGWHRRMLVISPFLSDLTTRRSKGVLDQLLHKRGAAQNVLVSRAEQLDALPRETISALQETTRIYVLDDVAANGAQDEEEGRPTPERESFSGLHAKLIVIEDGSKNVSIYTGSANATLAGWGRAGHPGNVEFVVELFGARRSSGIDVLLGENQPDETGSGGLLKVLKPYVPPKSSPDTDPDAERAEHMLDEAREAIARATLGLEVIEEADSRYGKRMSVFGLAKQEGIAWEAWPATLPAGRAQRFLDEPENNQLEFVGLTVHALTVFWAFRATATSGAARASVEFVLKLPAAGMPESRNRAVLASLIDNSDRFLRYLALLLVEDPDQPGKKIIRPPGPVDPNLGGDVVIEGLLEDLVRAYSRSPERIERIRRLVDDLAASGSASIPAKFAEVWRAFDEAGESQ